MIDGGPAFPGPSALSGSGMSLRDYLATHGPEPSKDEVLRIMEREQRANPHNEPYHNKVRRRGELEIRCALRFEWADAMLAARSISTSDR